MSILLPVFYGHGQFSPLISGRLDSLCISYKDSGMKGILFIQQGPEILFQRTYGYSDKEQHYPVDDYTKIESEGFKDVLLSYAIMALESQGKLNLQDSMVMFYPDCSGNFKKVSVKQLLMHVSGIDDRSIRKQYLIENKSDIFKALNSKKSFVFVPDSAYLYSEIGLFILKDIIEKLTQKNWTEFITETILKPGGLVHSSFQVKKNSGKNLMDDPTEFVTNLVDLKKFYYAVNENIFLTPSLTARSFDIPVPLKRTAFQTQPHTLCRIAGETNPETRVIFHYSSSISYLIYPAKKVLVIQVNFMKSNKVQKQALHEILHKLRIME